MSSFVSRWNKKEPSSSTGGLSRFRDAIRSPEPLKPKLELATHQLKAQIAKLDGVIARLKERDSRIFQAVIRSVQKNDNQHANMLANELSEVRKTMHLVTQAKLAFEQVELRISTVQDLGDVATMLSPAVGIIRNVSPVLTSVVPEAQSEVGEISELLSGVLVDAGQMSNSSINFESANEEADKVLTEAAIVAEQNMKEKFPDLPETVSEREYEEAL